MVVSGLWVSNQRERKQKQDRIYLSKDFLEIGSDHRRPGPQIAEVRSKSVWRFLRKARRA